MISHVVRAALGAHSVRRVVVATDHAGVAAAATSAGATAVMTDSALPTGTDRVAAAMRQIGEHADVVVNVQGDEPLIDPASIDLAANLLLAHAAADIATLSAPLPADALLDPSRVKVVCGPAFGGDSSSEACHRALFFSRAPIGVDRSVLRSLLLQSGGSSDGSSQGSMDSGRSASQHAARLHVGLYAFRPDALQRFVSLPPSPLESLEQLEQMRALEAGMIIAVGEVHHAARGVDTEEDLLWLEQRWRSSQARSSPAG